jgi:thymidine kinase
MVGELHLIMGCMRAGKTTKLISILNQYKNVFYINSIKDDRSDFDEILSHDGATVKAVKCNLLSEINVPSNLVIGIDECQFFDDLEKFVNKYLHQGYIIYLAGLDGDCRQKKFGKLTNLIPIADTYIKLYANCFCNKPAPLRFLLKTPIRLLWILNPG